MSLEKKKIEKKKIWKVGNFKKLKFLFFQSFKENLKTKVNDKVAYFEEKSLN